MANVDACVRYCESFFTVQSENLIDNIFNLNEENKIKIFRGKDKFQIKSFLENAVLSVKTHINEQFYSGIRELKAIILEKSSDDNRDGADLFHTLPDGKTLDIELKFGNFTDKAIGMEAFENIFKTNVFSRALSIPNRKDMFNEYKKRFYMNRSKREAEDYVQNELFEMLNSSIQEFNLTNQKRDMIIDDESQVILENTILNNSGSIRENDSYYIKFILQGNDLINTHSDLVGKGRWYIDPVLPLDGDVIKRVTVYLKNEETRIQIKFLLNWKNNFKKDNFNIPAKFGLGSPSWNVWVDSVGLF